MRLKDTFKMSIIGLSTHKSRSFLTILGIVIGIASIMLVMSIGQSAQQLIVGQIQSLGPNNVFVLPGREAGFSAATLFLDSLKQKDYEDLQNKNNVPDAVDVIPFVSGAATISYENEVQTKKVAGTTEKALKGFNLEMQEGDFFSSTDVDFKSQIVVLGGKVKEKLFGESTAVGQKVKIKEKNYKVIGVLKNKGSSAVSMDENIILPYTTAQQYITGTKHFTQFVMVASSQETLQNMIKDTKIVLRNNHNIDNPDKDDFSVRTLEELASTIGTVTTILTILLTSVAAISLVVGGIGIMNIMLVSVTERTREIGLRKAIGATNKNILMQFLTEAVLLTITGGIIGIILGTLLSFIASYAVTAFAGLNFPFAFSYQGAFWGVFVSSAIGFIFGIFPARQASKKSPMEALRYE